MDTFSDDEFSMPKGSGSPAHFSPISSPISSALDSSPLKRILGSSLHRPDESIGIENSSGNSEQTIEEEELEEVRDTQGVSYQLQERMEAVLKELRAQRMGVGTFIRAWVEQDDEQHTRRIGLLRKLASQDPILSEVFGPEKHNTFDSDVIRELNGLIDRPFFNQFKEEGRSEDIQYAGAYLELERNAPIWCGFLMQVLQHSRAHQASYYRRKDLAPVQQKAYLITSIICKAQATNTSNYLSKTLGLYMISSGVKKRVINVLAGLGICDSYKPLNELYDRIADKGEVSSLDLIMIISISN
jgi:hypothetical protein